MAKKKNFKELLHGFPDKTKLELPSRESALRMSYFFVLIIIIPLLFPSGRSFKYTDLTIYSVVNKKVIAPFTFSVLKTDEELAADREKAEKEVPYFFDYDEQTEKREIERIKNFKFLFDSLAMDLNKSAKRAG